MSSLKRAFLFVTRKKGKSVLMFTVLLTIATFALTSLSIGKSSEREQERLRETLGGEINLAVSYSEDNPYTATAEIIMTDIPPDPTNQSFISYTQMPITQKEIDAIMDIYGVVAYDAQISNYIMRFANIEYIPGTMQLLPTEQRMAKQSIVSGTEEMEYFRSGALTLTQGRHFGTNDSNTAVISKDLAERNGLGLDDTLILQGYNERLEGDKLYMSGETITEVTRVGIFCQRRKEFARKGRTNFVGLRRWADAKD
jgi:putative ABC transport system permease protein